MFTQSPSKVIFNDRSEEPLHVALVRIKAPQSVDNNTLKGVGHTLSQLTLLGLSCVVVVDPCIASTQPEIDHIQRVAEQAELLVSAIDGHGGQGGLLLDSVLETVPHVQQHAASAKVRGYTQITNRDLILAPLRRGIIPVIAPIAFSADSSRLRPVTADEAVLALTREFAGIQTNPIVETDPVTVAEKIASLQRQASLDRLIILDPVGSIPSTDGSNRAHVFINLEQEYDGIREDLLRALAIPVTEQPPSGHSGLRAAEVKTHVENLDLLKNALGLLPPSSSGLVTTLHEAANLRPAPSPFLEKPGVGTRPRRNPLIHNLLTDKPVLSPSLPARPTHLSSRPVPTPTSATFVKRGMPVSIFPDPRIQPWKPPTPSSTRLQLTDSRLDLARLIHLIEDSFNRALDVPHYLSRIENRIAGIIICGEYEGGAILTWESPAPNCVPERLVPYLDKFAVLQRSQGAGGVADIVFKAMVRDCFPDGICWRSRRDNPVNKWYFERAQGTWKMPASDWTMFWTTAGVEVGRGGGVFRDYEAVCKNVRPSWTDKTAAVD